MIKVIVFFVGVTLTLLVMSPLLIFLYDVFNGNFTDVSYHVEPINNTHVVLIIKLTYLNEVPLHDLYIKISLSSSKNVTILHKELYIPLFRKNQSTALKIVINIGELRNIEYVSINIKGVIGGLYPISINLGKTS